MSVLVCSQVIDGYYDKVDDPLSKGGTFFAVCRGKVRLLCVHKSFFRITLMAVNKNTAIAMKCVVEIFNIDRRYHI